jgi:hypothetical protein
MYHCFSQLLKAIRMTNVYILETLEARSNIFRVWDAWKTLPAIECGLYPIQIPG